MEKKRPADVHDAGRGQKEAQLMLIRLGVGAACGKKGAPADAHDDGPGCGL